MHARSTALLGAVLLILSGCASTDEPSDISSSGTPPLPFTELKAAPDSYKGQSVTFGGQVLAARRLKDGTRLEILQLPLTSSLQPTANLRQSQGRFVATQREFLDPATIPPGTLVTVTGDVSGSVTLPLDETDYTYPVVEIKNLRVWTLREETPVRIRPYTGPGYGGPYWSPYWRPWPY